MFVLNEIAALREHISLNPLSLVFIKTTNCSVCDSVYAKTEELLKRFDQINGVLVSMEQTPSVAAEFLVLAAPTILLFVESKEVFRASRFVRFEKLEMELEKWSEFCKR